MTVQGPLVAGLFALADLRETAFFQPGFCMNPEQINKVLGSDRAFVVQT